MEKLAANYLRVRSNGQLTLPAEIRQRAGVQAGDLFEVLVESDGSIHLLPKTQPDRKLAEKQQLKDIRWARKQKMVK
jgi:AbrB family looped-hinge helix DNA binding protein